MYLLNSAGLILITILFTLLFKDFSGIDVLNLRFDNLENVQFRLSCVI